MLYHQDNSEDQTSTRETDWPVANLEAVGMCPICKSDERVTYRSGLRDHIFAAPGAWRLRRCSHCETAYLDPRPDKHSINLAYAEYYTHENAPSPAPQHLRQSRMRRCRRKLREGYLKRKFHITGPPGYSIGRWLVPLFFPFRRRAFDVHVRHLRLPRISAKLLDVGCGNGAFIRRAATLGWDAQGIDPDPKAVELGRRGNLRIEQSSFPNTGLSGDSFEAVTMNHVIEHLHDPVSALQEANRLLTRGGKLWIATPNLDSPLSRIFGDAWRGLEPPRHLVVFNSISLICACHKAGFKQAKLVSSQPTTRWMFLASKTIAEKSKNSRSLVFEGMSKFILLALEWLHLIHPRWGEELVVVAIKE